MKIKYFFSLVLFWSYGLYANNIQVSNVTLTGQDPVNNFTLVQFDLSWENSWRLGSGPSNWDAAWVFIKYRENGGPWQHAKLNYVDGTAASDGHTQPSGCTINTSSDQTGCFVYRDAVGSGNISWTGIQLKWDYGANGVDDESMIDIKVLAIEMVYIPQGSFPLGTRGATGSDETDQFYLYIGGSGATQSYVFSEGQITIGNPNTNTSGLYYETTSSFNSGDQQGPIPAAFPKGYAAFYVMKYEVSEEQYIIFFNMLPDAAKASYDITGFDAKDANSTVSRNTIQKISGSGYGWLSTAAPSRSVSFINWRMMGGYLDWCGLRPFTELEYEKMCRKPGTSLPVAKAYPWGNTLINSVRYTISNDGAENATINFPGVGLGNSNYSATSIGAAGSGPLRVGIFAASAVTKNREETGASYYGVMELGGNLFERCISVGSSDNRSFTGLHGDGELNASSFYDQNVLNWPAPGTQSLGPRAFRGGSHNTPADRVRISDRYAACADNTFSSAQISQLGIRGARTAE